MKLRKTTVENLRNKCPTISELLENGLSKIDDIQKLFHYIDNNTNINLVDELMKYVNNLYIFEPDCEYLEHFIMNYVNKNINNLKSNYSDKLSEEEQIKIFNKVREFKRDNVLELVDTLNNFDRSLVLEVLKENDYINE